MNALAKFFNLISDGIERGINYGFAVLDGTDSRPPEYTPFGIGKPRYTGPQERTKRAMIRYATARNPRRMARLRKDFIWLQKMMTEMEMNPEDARFLL